LPNFRISVASPNSPAAGSPVRLNAPAQPGLRESASARMTAALALGHSIASPGATPSLREDLGRIPILAPARQIVAALDNQNSLPGFGKAPGRGPTSGS
jgi:hypothetical protein